MAGHTKAFDYPVMDHWGKVKVLQHKIRTTGLSVHSQTRQPLDHADRPKSEDQLYPGSSTGDLLRKQMIHCLVGKEWKTSTF